MSGESSEDRDADDGGTYTLIIDLAAPAVIDVGALGEHRFEAGPYAYTGSALGAGGFARVDRHRRTARGDHDVHHWHVDYLLGHSDARIERVVRSVGADVECAVADQLPPGPVSGFGASDCGCPTHLAAAEGESLDAVTGLAREVHEAAVASLGAAAGAGIDVAGDIADVLDVA